jgi:hypothetical protein
MSYEIRYEKMGGTYYYMIYRKKFLWFSSFFERWNTPESVDMRITELRND